MALGKSVENIVKDAKNPLLGKHESWERVPLCGIAKVLNGFAFESSFFNKSVGEPLLRIRDVRKDNTDTFYNGPYDKSYTVDKGDLIVGMDGDFHSGIWNGPKALLNQRVCKIILESSHYNKAFLYYALQPYLDAINGETSSVTVKHLSSNTILEIPLPLPPLPEQHRIVSKIEELFTKLDAGVDELKKAKTRLKRYRQAVLKYAIEGKLTQEWRRINKEKIESASAFLGTFRKEKEPHPDRSSGLPELPEKWTWANLSELGRMVGGGTPAKSCKEYWDGGSVLWISPKDMKAPYISTSEDRITELAISNSAAKLISAGSLLFVVRSGILRRTLPVALTMDDVTINQDMKALIPHQGLCTKYLLFTALALNEHIRKSCMKDGTTVESISVSRLQRYPLPIPPIKEQEVIVVEVERMLSIIEIIESNLKPQFTRTAKLRQSILKEAFSGRLVPQDPTDEPAERLLERIKSEMNQKNQTKPKTRARKSGANRNDK
jgi:type I restriction enzyme S subunit